LGDLRASYDVQVAANSVTKKGDRTVLLKMANKNNPKASYDVRITLYANSDLCFIKMDHAQAQTHLCCFRGRIRPA